MGIFQRTGDMISATVGDLLDRFENPVKMLRHALREIDDSVADVSAAVARSIAAERLLAREQQSHQVRVAEWGARARKAVEKGNDDLARRAIGQKLDHEASVLRLDTELTEARATNERLRREVETLRQRRATARRQLAALVARQAAIDARHRIGNVGSSTGAVRHSLARFDRFREKIELAEAEAIAAIEFDQSELESTEFEIDERQQLIDAELAAMQSEHRAASPT